MSVHEILGKIKGYLEIERVFYALVVILLSTASFGLGRLSVGGEVFGTPAQKMLPRTSSPVGKPPLPSMTATTTLVPEKHIASSSVAEVLETGTYVGSKKGTKYHLPWCSGAQRINDDNKVWFADKASAEKAGYTPAGNCPGI